MQERFSFEYHYDECVYRKEVTKDLFHFLASLTIICWEHNVIYDLILYQIHTNSTVIQCGSDVTQHIIITYIIKYQHISRQMHARGIPLFHSTDECYNGSEDNKYGIPLQ